MQIHKFLFITVLFASGHLFAEEVVEEVSKPEIKTEQDASSLKTGDNFQRLVDMHMRARTAALEAQLNESKRVSAGSHHEDGAPVNANPLQNANQRLLNSEPTLEAIWGMVGQEVAEINYKGDRVPVSLLQPVVSQEDGWFLEEIKPRRVTVVKKKGKRVIKRKEITLNWQGNIGGVIEEPSQNSVNKIPGVSGASVNHLSKSPAYFN